MSERDEIITSLAPMFKEARERGLWFYTGYHDVWFSPDELEQAHAEGRFVWGPPNWKLRDPRERLDEFRRTASNMNQAAVDFARRMKESGL